MRYENDEPCERGDRWTRNGLCVMFACCCSLLWVTACSDEPDDASTSSMAGAGAAGATSGAAGNCDMACPAQTPVCQGGVCVSGCSEGESLCDGVCVDTARDADHCGACNAGCSNDNGATACQQGACAPSCAPGFDDCDGDSSNGCEASLTTADHCGACDSKCEVTNADASCASGSCEVGACEEGYSDCDGEPSNGCEVFTKEDNANCGACGKICGTGKCLSSKCYCATFFNECGATSECCSNGPALSCVSAYNGDPKKLCLKAGGEKCLGDHTCASYKCTKNKCE
jgi:hypothetical protein